MMRSGVDGRLKMIALLGGVMLSLSPRAWPVNAPDALAALLDDRQTLRAANESRFADALALIEGAAMRGPDRLELITGLHDGLPRFSEAERVLLLVRFLERSPGASPEQWERTLATVETLPALFTEPMLAAAFFRLSARHDVRPRLRTMMQAGNDLADRLEREPGDSTVLRWAIAYLDVAHRFPDPALAAPLDRIARRSRNREIVTRARRISRSLFD